MNALKLRHPASNMLTLDLIKVRFDGENIVPWYVEVESERYLEVAQTLIESYETHKGKIRKQLNAAIEGLLNKSKDVALCRGLNKLLEDRCEFDIPTALDLSSIRRTVFEIASRNHRQGNFNRQDVLKEASLRLSIPEEQIENFLFADLRQNHIIRDFKPISPHNLLHRYNTALAQGVLLKALQIRIRIREQNHLRYRQLFKAIKFQRLLYQIEGNYEDGFYIMLDGPMSLFKGGQKYGLQMALFLPALLLCKNWEMEAILQWRNRKSTQFFRLTDEKDLKSYCPDTGMYMPPELLAFQQRFQNLKSAWGISHECDFLQIAPQELCIPDYVFIHPSGAKVYLEIFGFWHKAALEKRLCTLAKQPLPILLAVSKKLAGERNAEIRSHPNLYWFEHVLNPREIAHRLDEY